MSASPTCKRNAIEVAESRRLLAADTLNAALLKERLGMQMALGMLLESRLFTGEEMEDAQAILDQLDCIEKQVREVYGKARANEKATRLHVSACTLAAEIDALRESAFWLLDNNGVLEMERAISQLLGAYEMVRQLVRIIRAKSKSAVPIDPMPLPAIGASRYLSFTHPETRRR